MTPDPACPTCAEQARRIRDLERKLATAELELTNAQQRADRYSDRYRALVGKMTIGSVEPVMFVDAVPATVGRVDVIGPEPVDECPKCHGTRFVLRYDAENPMRAERDQLRAWLKALVDQLGLESREWKHCLVCGCSDALDGSEQHDDDCAYVAALRLLGRGKETT